MWVGKDKVSYSLSFSRLMEMCVQVHGFPPTHLQKVFPSAPIFGVHSNVNKASRLEMEIHERAWKLRCKNPFLAPTKFVFNRNLHENFALSLYESVDGE